MWDTENLKDGFILERSKEFKHKKDGIVILGSECLCEDFSYGEKEGEGKYILIFAALESLGEDIELEEDYIIYKRNIDAYEIRVINENKEGKGSFILDNDDDNGIVKTIKIKKTDLNDFITNKLKLDNEGVKCLDNIKDYFTLAREEEVLDDEDRALEYRYDEQFLLFFDEQYKKYGNH